jgi:plasmid segregation protein ParM
MKRRHSETSSKSRTPQDACASNGSLPTLIGLDVGYGFTKIVREDLNRVLFPSAVAPVPPSIVDIVLTGGDEEIEVEGSRFLVGQKAIEAPFRFRDQYDSWWTSPAYKALVRYARQWIPSGGHILTGLPLHVYSAQEARDQVRDVIKRGLQAAEVTVLPQGVGAYCSQLESITTRERVAIVDIGMRTTELVGMAGMQFLGNLSGGLILGVTDLFAIVAEELTKELGRQVDPYEVDQAARGEAEIRAQGRVHPSANIIDRLQPLAQRRAEQVQQEMTRLWGAKAAAFDRVVYCGGGATLLYPHMDRYREGALLLPDAQYANAIGFLKIGLSKRGCLTDAPRSKSDRATPASSMPTDSDSFCQAREHPHAKDELNHASDRN